MDEKLNVINEKTYSISALNAAAIKKINDFHMESITNTTLVSNVSTNVATIIVDILSETFHAAVQGYPNDSYIYEEKCYDSGWITSKRIVILDDISLYYRLIIRKRDGSVLTLEDAKNVYFGILRKTEELESKTEELEKSVTNFTLDYFFETQNVRIGTILGYDVKTIIINKLEAGFDIGVQGWTDSSRSEKIYDSGWINAAKNLGQLDESLWYYITIRNLGMGTITIDDVRQNVSIQYYTSLPRQIKELENRTEELESKTEEPKLLSSTVHTIAHRGDDIDAPQCVAASYIAARKRGHEIAENDVFNSADGQYIMWHDSNLGRLGNLVDLTGRYMYTDGSNYYWYNPKTRILYDDNELTANLDINDLTRCSGSNYSVTDFSFKTVRKIDFGAYFNSKFAGSQVLTFEEWVMLCKKLGMQIYIDNKIVYTKSVLTDLYNIVKKCGMLNKTTWIISSHDLAAFFRTLDPNSRIVALTHPNDSNISTWKDIRDGGRGFAFNGDGKTATKEAIQLGLENGYEVEVWYVDFYESKEETLQKIRDLVGYGITGLTTDKYRVDEAFEYMLN